MKLKKKKETVFVSGFCYSALSVFIMLVRSLFIFVTRVRFFLLF